MVGTNKQYTVRPGVLPERELTDEEVGFKPVNQQVSVRPGVLPEEELTDEQVGFKSGVPARPTAPHTPPPPSLATATTGTPDLELPPEVYPPAPEKIEERIPGQIYYHPAYGEALRWTPEGQWISPKEPYPSPAPKIRRYRNWRELYHKIVEGRYNWTTYSAAGGLPKELTKKPKQAAEYLQSILEFSNAIQAYQRLPDKWKHPDDKKNLQYIAEKVWLWNELPENMRKWVFEDMTPEQIQQIFDDPAEVAEIASAAKAWLPWTWGQHLIYQRTKAWRPEGVPHTIAPLGTEARRMTPEERARRGLEWQLEHKHEIGREGRWELGPLAFDPRTILHMGEVAAGELANLLLTGIGAVEWAGAKISGKQYKGIAAQLKRNINYLMNKDDLKRYGIEIPPQLTDEQAQQIIEKGKKIGDRVAETIARIAPYMILGVGGAGKKAASVFGKEAVEQALKRTIAWSVGIGTLRGVEDLVEGVDPKTALRDAITTAFITSLLVGAGEGVHLGLAYRRLVKARPLVREVFARYGIKDVSNKVIDYYIRNPEKLEEAIRRLTSKPPMSVATAKRLLGIRADKFTVDDVNRAFRDTIKRVHPDLHPDTRLSSLEQYLEARDVLRKYAVKGEGVAIKPAAEAVKPSTPAEPLALPKPAVEGGKPIITPPLAETPKTIEKPPQTIPKRVYHATPYRFEGLPKPRAKGLFFREPAGAYYSYSPAVAMGETGKWRTTALRVIVAEPTPKNPLVLKDEKTQQWYDDLYAETEREVIERKIKKDPAAAELIEWGQNGEIINVLYEPWNKEIAYQFARKLRSMGYDAVYDPYYGRYIALKKSAVKQLSEIPAEETEQYKQVLRPPAETPKAVEAPKPVAKPPEEIAKVSEKVPEAKPEVPKPKEVAPEAKAEPVKEAQPIEDITKLPPEEVKRLWIESAKPTSKAKRTRLEKEANEYVLPIIQSISQGNWQIIKYLPCPDARKTRAIVEDLVKMGYAKIAIGEHNAAFVGRADAKVPENFEVVGVRREPEVKPVEEVKHEPEVETAPTAIEGAGVEEGKAVEPAEAKPTKKPAEKPKELDPTKPEDAEKILQIYAKEHEVVHRGIAPEDVDVAFKTVAKQIPTGLENVKLWAIPGKEKEAEKLVAELQKEAKRKITAGKPRPLKPAEPKLPRPAKKKEDIIAAVSKAKAAQRYAAYNPATAYVNISGNELAATDGHRLFVAYGEWGKDGLYEVGKKGTLGKQMTDWGWKFPDYKSVIPKEIETKKPSTVIDVEKTWRMIRQARILADPYIESIYITLDKDGNIGFIGLSSAEGSIAEVGITPTSKIVAAVNPKFIQDALEFHAKLGDKEVPIWFTRYTGRQGPIATKTDKGLTLTMPKEIEGEAPSIEELRKEVLPTEPEVEEKPKPAEAMAKEGKVSTEKEPKTKPEAPKGAGMAAAVKEGAFGEIGKPTPPKGKTAIEAPKPTKPMKIGDAIDTIGAIADSILDPIKQIIAPGSRSGAKLAASLLRENLARLAQKTDAARETLKAAKRKFATMSKEAVLDFIDRMEKGLPQDSAELNDIASKMRKLLDERRDIIRAMGKGYLEEYIINYFPHIWKNPDKAKVVIAKILAKRPLAGRKSFLKHRKIPTIKEGIELGLELVNDNPVDLVLLKLYEMDKFIMGKHLISQLKDHGQIRFVYARAKPPEGYLPLTDSLFQVYLPPGATLTVKEAYDQTLVENLLAIANSLGIKHERLMKLRGAAWGRQKGGKIETRFAAPESVLTHEIGHVLGERYGLMEYILGKRQTAYYRRGAKAGEPKLTKTGKVRTEYADQSPEAKELRKILNKEWRALADLRYEGKEVPESFKKYVRRKGEKEAVLLQAYIHAPEKFKEVAPTLFERFEHFLNSHPELHPLTELKSSLVLGESEGNIPIPGITKLGSYYAPEPVATVINNHLSPGLRSSRYAAIRATYDLLRRQANALNMVQLTASAFHALNTGLDTAGSMVGLGIRKLFIRGQRLEGLSDIAKGLTVIGPPIRNLWIGDRLYKAMQKDLSEIADPELRKTIEYIIMAGGRAKMDPMYHLRGWNALLDTVGQIVRGKPLQKIAAVAKLPANIAGTVIEAISYPVIQWWVPRLKLAVMRDMILSELERARKYGLSDEQLRLSLAKAWDSVDNRLGQLVYDNLFWNKVLKDGLMLAFRTVGWNLGFIREYAGAPIDLLATPTRLRSGDALISFRMAYVMGITAVYAITGAVITYLLTGKPPKEAKDYAFPPTGRELPDGTKERLNLPTYTRDAIGYAIRPRETIQNKLHPLWSVVARTLANKDFFGSEIRNPNDPWMKQLRDSIAYIIQQYRPISVQNYLRMRETGAEKVKALIVSATGITTAAGYIRRTRAQRLMLHYILENLPRAAKPKKLAEKAKLRKQLITWLREGKPIESLPWEGFSNEEIARILTIARRPPLADAYSRLTVPQAINVYLVANKEEAKIFAGILIAKMNRLSKSRPDYEDIKAMYEEIRKQDPILQKIERNPVLMISSLLRVDPTHADKEQIKEAIDKELATLQKAIRIKNPDLPESIVKRKAKIALRRRLRSAAPPKDIDPEGRARYLVAVDKFIPQESFKKHVIEQIRILAADYQQGDKSDAEFEAYLKEKAEQRRQAYLYLKAAGVELDEAKDMLEEAMAGRRLRNKRIDAVYRLEERWRAEDVRK